MQAPGAQQDPEEQRLQALLDYRVLDTAAEPGIDDLTRLAAGLFGTPMALVSLVDRDRQWFKSRIGMDATETPRCVAFCDHAIRDAGVLVVQDAHADPRFADNPLVTADPHIRFYAGAPLLTPQGHALGTLCVLDRQPRSFDATQADALAALARQVVAQFELHRRQLELSEAALGLRAERDRLREAQARLALSETRMSLVLKGANDGWWDWDLVSGERYHSPRGWAMLGYANDELPYDGDLWERLIHPEDMSGVDRIFVDAIRSDVEHYSAEMRLRHKDGHYIPVLSRGYILRDPASGRAVRLSGTNTDLSERRQAERALQAEQQLNRQIVETSPVGIAIYDAAGDCVTANPAMARHIGADLAALKAQNMHRIVSWKAAGIYALALKTLQGGEPTSTVVHPAHELRPRGLAGDELRRAGLRRPGPADADGQRPDRREARRTGAPGDAGQLRDAVRQQHGRRSADASRRQRAGGQRGRLCDARAQRGRGLCTRSQRPDGRHRPTPAAAAAGTRPHRPRTRRAAHAARQRRAVRGGDDIVGLPRPRRPADHGGGVPRRHRAPPLGTAAAGQPDLVETTWRSMCPASSTSTGSNPTGTRTFRSSARASGRSTSSPPSRCAKTRRWCSSACIPTTTRRWPRPSAPRRRPCSHGARNTASCCRCRASAGARATRCPSGWKTAACSGTISSPTSPNASRPRRTRTGWPTSMPSPGCRTGACWSTASNTLSARRSAAGRSGALLFIDLDNFKQINDARGHSVGDRLLEQVARRLSQQLRGEDSVARLGGDEFVVLVGHLGQDIESGARHARAVADKVRELLEQPYDIDGTLYGSSGSIGITLFPKADERVDDLLREADTAMYRAKSAGRNRIAFFEPAMQAEVEERLALEQDLKEAVGSAQIVVYVQPQFDADGVEVGGELLLRWLHPTRGPISPAQFIPIAEDTGLILPLGEFVIRQACDALVRMQAAGRALPLSVNVSPRQFRKDDFVQQVRDVLAATGAPASGLVFEVTESLLIDDWEGAQARMSELVQLGIRFSIDDFGTGYSSLAYLRKLPLFELKIDRSFVRDTPHDPSDTSIVETILSMARNLKLRVVAEGVETRAQADFLVAAGCPVLQGFLFARPQPLADWLAQRLALTVEG